MGRVWERPVSTDLVVSLGPGVTGADSWELTCCLLGVVMCRKDAQA